MADRLSRTWSNLRQHSPEKWRVRLDRALQRVHANLGKVRLPLVTAHGDFAPWNTRLFPNGELYVFDWEMIREECTPLFDIFHFEFMTAVMLGKGVKVLQLNQIIKMRSQHLSEDISKSLMPALFGAYLVDVVLYYLGYVVERGYREDDRVLMAAAPLFDSLEQWWHA